MKLMTGQPWRQSSMCRSSMFRSTMQPHQKESGVSRPFSQQCHHQLSRSNNSHKVKEPLKPSRAYIALGSNLGDRIANIERACEELNKDGLYVRRTSALYETAPMYVEDQAEFINGVCETEIEPSISPLELLSRLKAIEDKMGRQKTIDKGPRNIDLDLLLQGNTIFNDPVLTIPHALMLEREFVLRPLCDLIPNSTHPKHPNTPFSTHLANLPPSAPMTTVTPLSHHQTSSALPPLKALSPTRRTTTMAILNLTPDSFSDGSLHTPTDPASLLPQILSQVASGATILDIGGQSTAPRAPEVSAAEELSRVLPTIEYLRRQRALDGVAISIDTYRACVAEAAVRAGADIVNDVSAGALDPAMLATVARLRCGFVMMHMRGTPATMAQAPHTVYPATGEDGSSGGGVVGAVARELGARVQAALEAGVPRWRIVLDPGIGFAKTQAGNLELLRRLGELREAEEVRGFPWLVGASRKGFVGKITGVKEPRERTWGTAAAVSAAVQGGADIVRVHDVDEMVKVVKMSDAIWRTEDV